MGEPAEPRGGTELVDLAAQPRTGLAPPTSTNSHTPTHFLHPHHLSISFSRHDHQLRTAPRPRASTPLLSSSSLHAPSTAVRLAHLLSRPRTTTARIGFFGGLSAAWVMRAVAPPSRARRTTSACSLGRACAGRALAFAPESGSLSLSWSRSTRTGSRSAGGLRNASCSLSCSWVSASAAHGVAIAGLDYVPARYPVLPRPSRTFARLAARQTSEAALEFQLDGGHQASEMLD